MLKFFLAASLALSPALAQAQDQIAPPAPSATPAAAKGATRETAYKVKSIGEEYAIMRKLGLETEMQSLVMDDRRRPYDVLTGKDAQTGEKRDVWFDIKSFY